LKKVFFGVNLMVEKVVLASPRGFCAGVVRAVNIVELAIEKWGSPVYVRGEIVHNPHVVRSLQQKGVIFVEELAQVPEGSRVIFSAHGVEPAVRKAAAKRSLKVLDATCPLVTKVHREAKKFAAKDYSIVLIGHEGHEEVIGTMGEAPGHIELISSREDIAKLEIEHPENVAYLTQTTLSVSDTREIIEDLKKQFPDLEGPSVEDICYATQNRQEAVRALAEIVDLILVVGAENSSNSQRLAEEARRHGIPAWLIGDVNCIKSEWLEGVSSVGLTSGASAPERLVDEVVSWFAENGATVEELVTCEEKTRFSLPAELR
jgi:4-hydroxy-3-methylbut-2-en-1-yl diphosphate reductase